jgi:hypothetical protein
VASRKVALHAQAEALVKQAAQAAPKQKAAAVITQEARGDAAGPVGSASKAGQQALAGGPDADPRKVGACVPRVPRRARGQEHA